MSTPLVFSSPVYKINASQMNTSKGNNSVKENKFIRWKP